MKYGLFGGLWIFLIACNEVVVHPVQGDIVEAVYGLGTVESDEVYNARSGQQVTVQEFYVVEGQDVKKGQRLFKIDQGVLLSSPIAGRVTQIPANARENISPQSLILNVTNLDKLYLSVALEQHAAMKIRTGLKTEVSFEFFRDKKIEGVVDSFYPKNNEFIARVRLGKIPQGVLPGMTADVAFEVARKAGATLLPAKALSNGHILLRRGGKKERVAVQVGMSDSDRVEVLEPALSVQDEIVMP